MTDGELLVATVAILLFSAVLAGVIDRWAEGRIAIRRRLDEIRRSSFDRKRSSQFMRVADLPPHAADDTQ